MDLILGLGMLAFNIFSVWLWTDVDKPHAAVAVLGYVAAVALAPLYFLASLFLVPVNLARRRSRRLGLLDEA